MNVDKTMGRALPRPPARPPLHHSQVAHFMYEAEPVSPRTSASVVKVPSPPQALGVVRVKTLARTRASNNEKQSQQGKIVLAGLSVFWCVVFLLFSVQDRQEAAREVSAAASMERSVVAVGVALVLLGGLIFAIRVGQHCDTLQADRVGAKVPTVQVSLPARTCRGDQGSARDAHTCTLPPLQVPRVMPLPPLRVSVGGTGGAARHVTPVGRWLAATALPAGRRRSPPPKAPDDEEEPLSPEELERSV